MKLRALALITIPVACALASDNDGARWWSYVEFLASDNLQGRNTGSEGHRKAAQYVASQFERDGLKPAGEQGYIQPVRFQSVQLDESKSSLALVRGGKERKLTLGEDATITTRVPPAPAIEAGLVFVGYGLRVPEKSYDDYSGLDTKGKIAVVLSGKPAAVPGALASHYATTVERWKTLQSLGFIGMITVANPRHMDIPWARIAANRTQPTMHLTAPGMQEGKGEQIVVAWNPAHADELLEGTGHTLNELVELAEAGKQLPRFAIQQTLKARTSLKFGDVESQNIAAIYPGTDPKLKDEYVLMSAHIDHLGVGNPVNGDSIFNGAMDDASGVASILEIAARFKETAPKLKRSVLFVAVTGEEKGLLGSKYFSTHTTVPASAIVADFNADMFLPLFPLKILNAYGLEESTLGDDLRAVASTMNITVRPDPEPARNIFIRSDQYSFISQGVPALMLDFGAVKGSKEDQMLKDWLHDRYHAPSDDLNQPVDKRAAATFNELFEKLIVRVANAPSRPAWKPDSFFRRFAGKAPDHPLQ